MATRSSPRRNFRGRRVYRNANPDALKLTERFTRTEQERIGSVELREDRPAARAERERDMGRLISAVTGFEWYQNVANSGGRAATAAAGGGSRHRIARSSTPSTWKSRWRDGLTGDVEELRNSSTTISTSTIQLLVAHSCFVG
jgi:hypothetical protein